MNAPRGPRGWTLAEDAPPLARIAEFASSNGRQDERTYEQYVADTDSHFYPGEASDAQIADEAERHEDAERITAEWQAYGNPNGS